MTDKSQQSKVTTHRNTQIIMLPAKSFTFISLHLLKRYANFSQLLSLLSLVTSIKFKTYLLLLSQTTVTSEDACRNIRNRQVEWILFSNMLFVVMFVTEVWVLFLIKLRWPKKKNINLVPRAHVPIGQHQVDTQLWNNQQARSQSPRVFCF